MQGLPHTIQPALAELKNLSANILGDNLLGIYVHGSIAMDCFNEKSSDIDVLVIVLDKLNTRSKRQLGEMMLLLVDRYNYNIEISVVTKRYLDQFTYPTPFEFHYSADHEKAFRNNEVDFDLERTDLDLAAHFVIAKQFGIAILGPEAGSVFPVVPRSAYLDSIASDAEFSYRNVMSGGDGEVAVPKYAVLNFCRVLALVREDLVTSKKSGAEWGLKKLPPKFKEVILQALGEYQEEGSSSKVDGVCLKKFAEYSYQEIEKARNNLKKARQ